MLKPLQTLAVAFGAWVNHRQLDTIVYLRKEVRVLREQLGPRRLQFTHGQRRRLARKGKALGRKLLREIATLASPETILAWHRKFVARKTSEAPRRPSRGRPPTRKEIAEVILRMARGSPTWGYTRIQGALRNLGYEVARGTIAAILKTYGLDPAPERGKRMTWAAFLNAHWQSIAATDFFTTHVWTARGLVAYYLVFFIEIATRRVEVTAISDAPNEKLMLQVGREVTDPIDGFLRVKKFLVMDRDAKYTAAFRSLLADAGVKPVVIPYRAVNMNAHAERFVRSIKEECLRHMIFIGEASLRRVVRSYLVHYRAERNHQGLDNRLIEPEAHIGSRQHPIACRKRLGGLLKYYHRAAA